MREKQLADLRDHGADTDNIIRREDLPETNDLMKLWDAKIHNDGKNISFYNLKYSVI